MNTITIPDGVPTWLIDTVINSPWLSTAFMMMGIFRVVFKPLVTMLDKAVLETPSQEDDSIWNGIKGSKPFRFVLWLVDLFTSVKLLTPAKTTNPNTAPQVPPKNTVAMLLAIGLGIAALPGCSTIAPGSDPVVVRAEQTRETAIQTFDAFLLYEYSNRDYLWGKSHDFKSVADNIRQNESGWIEALNSGIKRYKENKADGTGPLTQALAAIETALAEAQATITRAKGTK